MQAAAIIAIVVSLASGALALDITTCMTVVPSGAIGVLQADLDCGGVPFGVDLAPRATLEMNGHSISSAGSYGVRCYTSRCTIIGPGRLFGNLQAVEIGSARLTIQDVHIHDNGYGLSGHGGTRIEARDVRVERCWSSGITAYVLKAVRVVSNGNRIGISAGRLIGEDVTANDNIGSGVSAHRRFRLLRFVASNNQGGGLFSDGGGRLEESTLSGNLYEGAPIDVLTRRRPRLLTTSCGRSLDPDTGTAWGVCADD